MTQGDGIVCWTDKKWTCEGYFWFSFPKQKPKFVTHFSHWSGTVFSGYTMYSCKNTSLSVFPELRNVYCKSNGDDAHTYKTPILFFFMSLSPYSYTAYSLVQHISEILWMSFTLLRHVTRQKNFTSYLWTEIGNKWIVIKDPSYNLSDTGVQVT